MTTNPQNQESTLELAKKGEPKAIAALINRQLNPKGITVKAGLKDDCLQIFLEAAESPEQNVMMPFIKKGMSNLGIKVIRTVRVYARQTGYSSVAWTEDFPLTTFVGILQEAISENLHTNVESNFSTYKRSSQGSSNHQIHTDRMQATLRDSVEGLKTFFVNPIGGLPIFYKSLGKQRALLVGLVFGAFYILCLIFSFRQPLSDFSFFEGKYNTVQVIALGATQFISFVVASILTRKVCRGLGSPEGDVFVAGTSLLAPGLLFLLSSILGVVNFEIILIASVLATTYLILTLYTGCHQISQIPESLSPLAVVVMLLLSLWFSKIIISAV